MIDGKERKSRLLGGGEIGRLSSSSHRKSAKMEEAL